MSSISADVWGVVEASAAAKGDGEWFVMESLWNGGADASCGALAATAEAVNDLGAEDGSGDLVIGGVALNELLAGEFGRGVGVEWCCRGILR